MKDHMLKEPAAAVPSAANPAPAPAPTAAPTPEQSASAEVLVVAEPEPERVHLHMPVDIRSVSLVLLAGLASLFVLHWAKAVFIPVMLSVLFSYALSPMVNWLELKHVPRWLSSAVLLLAIVGAIGSTVYSLGDQASQLVEAMPVATQKFRQALKARSGKSNSTLDIVQKAAAQIEQAAKESGSAPVVTRGAMRVIVEPASFDIKKYLWSGTIGLIALIGQTAAVLFLTYFLMLSGDTFRRKLVKLAGPTLTSKKITLQALQEVTGQIQRYLQVQLLTSVVVGLLSWLALLALGLDNAPVWGVIAGVLNLVPYVGSLVTAAASGLVGFLQFGSLNMAMAVGGASLLIHTLVGNLLTPWLTSRASRLSPVAVFVGLLAWGWLWGVWGLLLGVPILMIVKSVCDRVDDLKPLGEFLGS
jgi:predicted PurR-regulated permease PerM